MGKCECSYFNMVRKENIAFERKAREMTDGANQIFAWAIKGITEDPESDTELKGIHYDSKGTIKDGKHTAYMVSYGSERGFRVTVETIPISDAIDESWRGDIQEHGHWAGIPWLDEEKLE